MFPHTPLKIKIFSQDICSNQLLKQCSNLLNKELKKKPNSLANS